MDHTHLFVQGPPGAGKTYTGSQLIVDLLAQGKRVGITSNSHKAINHLLRGVVRRCSSEQGVAFSRLQEVPGSAEAANSTDGAIDRRRLRTTTCSATAGS